MPTIPAQTIGNVSIPQLTFQELNNPFNCVWYSTSAPRNGDHNGTIYYCTSKQNASDTTAYYVLGSSQQCNGRFPQAGNNFFTNFNLSSSFTYNGLTVYYAYFNNGACDSIDGVSTSNNSGISPSITDSSMRAYIAWLMIYGGYLGYDITYDLDNCVGDPNNPTNIPPNATVTNFDFTPDTDFEFNSGSVWIDGDGASQGIPVVFNWDYETGHLRVGIVSSNITIHVHAYGDPYADIDGEGALPGSGTVGVPGLPGLTAVSSGVIGLFSPSANQMKLLSDFMWTDFGGTGSTEVDVLKEVVQAIKRLISNPLDYIVGLNIIPSQGLSIGSAQEIRFGFVNSGVSMPRLTNQYFTVDCGSLNFDTVCGDTFLDYAPYSKFSIYLPYIGVKDVDANDFVGHTISVLYRGDVVTGGVTAYILKDGSVMYQYSGCCAMNVPLSADSWGTTISGAVQIATSIVAGAVSGGGAGATMAMAKGASSVASNPSMLSPQVAHSGAVSGSAGCMGVQYPFVIREAVRFHSTVGMNTVSGYPSYYYKKLSTVHGYTEVLDVHLKDISATDGEIAEIETLLKGGVIL